MYKIRRLHKLITSLPLVVVFLVALAATCPGPYNIYVFRESGGPALGPWYQLIGTATSPMGGNVALNSSGTAIVLDNRTWWPTSPTQIVYNPDAGKDCGVRGTPCKEEF